jgi:hypothetical protein
MFNRLPPITFFFFFLQTAQHLFIQFWTLRKRHNGHRTWGTSELVVGGKAKFFDLNTVMK